MKQMQLIQPEIEKLKAKYKDNPQKMQREQMELYKARFGGFGKAISATMEKYINDHRYMLVEETDRQSATG